MREHAAEGPRDAGEIECVDEHRCVLDLAPAAGAPELGAEAGSDVAETMFKYVPVRRLADFIERSLRQSLRWAAFEPNGPALWSSIAREVTAFMAGLYGNGAFTGATAEAAYSVACDATTTTAGDMLSGVVNLSIGFTPADWGDFVLLNIPLDAARTAS